MTQHSPRRKGLDATDRLRYHAAMLTFWITFHVVIAICLFIDLFCVNRHHHVISMREASLASAFWILLALAFCAGVFHWKGHADGLTFLTAYLMEESLSIDNLFVFYLLFRHFGIKREDEHTMLFYGVMGAIVMRATFIGLGVALVSRFKFLFYVFGAFLVWSGLTMWNSKEADEEENKLVKWLRRIVPVAPAGTRGFVARHDGRLMLTMSAFALIAIELSDLMFALDSIPAVLGLTQDFFVAYTSNILAILGLRSLYFMLAGAIGRFQRLHYGLSLVLTFIGAKMLVMEFVHVPIGVSLGVIAVCVGGSVALDLIAARRKA